MGYRRPGFAVIAASCLFVSVIAMKSQPAQAASAAVSAAAAQSSLAAGAERIEERVLHRHRTQSFYCYPRNYWWFYRPYTTAVEGYARCMPYFHYLPGRGAKSQPYVK